MFKRLPKQTFPKTCHISFELERSCLVISASNQETAQSKRITRSEDSVKRINELSQTYRTLVALRSFAEENDRGVISLVEKLGEQLYQLFFEGLEELFSTSSNLIIEHSLFLIPLELAFDGKEFIGLKYAIGNWMQKSGHMPVTAYKDSTSQHLSNVLEVLFLGQESESVPKIFADKLESSISCTSLRRSHSEFLLEQLRSHPYSVIHLACHGRFDEADPDHSFLILDQDKAGRNESALLTCHQIEHTQLLSKPLVFLNACHSGLVKENYLGFVGFADSLLKSGATNCITTLWSVSDQSASRFAAAFYMLLLLGEPIGEALRKARLQCWYEKRDILTSLSYILFGDPTRRINIQKGQDEEVP